ncbi:hypothetical protein ES703_72243 [subsurface metagenome]
MEKSYWVVAFIAQDNFLPYLQFFCHFLFSIKDNRNGPGKVVGKPHVVQNIPVLPFPHKTFERAEITESNVFHIAY